MGFKYLIPWVGRLYRQRDEARLERQTARCDADLKAADINRLGLRIVQLSKDLAAAQFSAEAATPEQDTAVREADLALLAPDVWYANGRLPYFYLNKIPPGAPFPDWSRQRFLKDLPPTVRLLDVGCGNNSPHMTKQLLPRCHYVGLDVGDYHQDEPNLADEYVLTTSAEFRASIASHEAEFGAVISSHNLEHCEDREGVLAAMAGALEPGGKLFLAFPCAASVDFPRRRGTLNYFQDSTHRGAPPDFSDVVAILLEHGVRVSYASTRYQPPIHWMVGLASEAASAESGALGDETWAFWGFETVIWGERV